MRWVLAIVCGLPARLEIAMPVRAVGSGGGAGCAGRRKLAGDAVAQHVAELDGRAAGWPEADRARLEAAITFAMERHAVRKTASGGSSVSHPLGVAAIVARLHADADTVIGAVLHDSVEVTDAELIDIERTFGRPVAALVDGAAKVAAVRGNDPDRLEAARLRRSFVAVAADPRVVVIKLADRLHELRTITSLPAAEQARIAREALAVHGPLAHRMGLAAIKSELEDRAFAIAHPEQFHQTKQVLADIPELEAALEHSRADLVAHLQDVEIDAAVHARIKHAWSVYRKSRAGYDVNSLHDLLGLRVIVDTVAECYAVLGEVHALWEPVSGRIKDYIARPKFNGYRSLHSTVQVDGRLLEVQIRTDEMHRQAELGDAAHHAYKTRTAASEPHWLQRLLDWQDPAGDGEDLDEVTSERDAEELWVLTPTAEVITLPAGAGVIDFAYAVHTEVGHRCSGARVNGRLVPLSTKLTSGDQVAILTARTTGPSLDWLAYVATGRARSRIRQWHNRLRRAATRRTGETILAALLRRHHTTIERAGPVLLLAGGVRSWDALADHVGSGMIELSLLERSLRAHPLDRATPAGVPQPTTPHGKAGPPALFPPVAPGLSGVDVAMAGCCEPVPPAAIVGVSSRARGVVAHRAECAEALRTIAHSPGRQVRIIWLPPGVRAATIDVLSANAPGALAAVLGALDALGAGIETSWSCIAEDGRCVQHYEVTHGTTPTKIRTALRAIPGVHSVNVT
jgi:GTP pyrophosphokinase